MSVGKSLIKGAHEALAIANGDLEPAAVYGSRKYANTEITDDIFQALEEETASLLRANMSQNDAVTLAHSHSPFGRRAFLGNKRQTRLFRKLKLIAKAKGQENFALDLCEFELTEFGMHVAQRLNEAHTARVNHLGFLRAETSSLLGQLKRAGHQEQSDHILQRAGVKTRRVHDIKIDKLEHVHSELSKLLEQIR